MTGTRSESSRPRSPGERAPSNRTGSEAAPALVLRVSTGTGRTVAASGSATASVPQVPLCSHWRRTAHPGRLPPRAPPARPPLLCDPLVRRVRGPRPPARHPPPAGGAGQVAHWHVRTLSLTRVEKASRTRFMCHRPVPSARRVPLVPLEGRIFYFPRATDITIVNKPRPSPCSTDRCLPGRCL